MAPVSSKEFLDIQATTECRFTLKLVRDMIRTYSLNLCNLKNSATRASHLIKYWFRKGKEFEIG